MAAEIKQQVALEIAHVLFIDIVAYFKMPMDDQRAAIAQLNQERAIGIETRIVSARTWQIRSRRNIPNSDRQQDWV